MKIARQVAKGIEPVSELQSFMEIQIGTCFDKALSVELDACISLEDEVREESDPNPH